MFRRASSAARHIDINLSADGWQSLRRNWQLANSAKVLRRAEMPTGHEEPGKVRTSPWISELAAGLCQ